MILKQVSCDEPTGTEHGICAEDGGYGLAVAAAVAGGCILAGMAASTIGGFALLGGLLFRLALLGYRYHLRILRRDGDLGRLRHHGRHLQG